MNFGKQKERMREIAALLAAGLARVPARPLLIALAFSLIAALAAVLYWNPPLSLEDEPDKVTFFQIGTGVVGGEISRSANGWPPPSAARREACAASAACPAASPVSSRSQDRRQVPSPMSVR